MYFRGGPNTPPQAMQNTPWVAPLRIPGPSSAPPRPAWPELSASPVTTGSTSDGTSPWHATPRVPILIPCGLDSSSGPRTNWPDAHSPPPSAGVIAPWQDATAEASRQSLPRCAVVSFRKDGDSVHWLPAAPSNSGGLGARVRGFDSAFELEEFSSRALVPRYVDLGELLAAIAAENQPRPPRRRSLRFRLRSNQTPVPSISPPPSNFAQRTISLPAVQRNYEEGDFESVDTRRTRPQSDEFEVERPRRSLLSRIRMRSRTRAFLRKFWRSSRSKPQPCPITEQAVYALLSRNLRSQ